MQILFFVGWILLILAFAAASTEPFLAQIGRGGLMTSSYDLWYALAPGNLVVTEIRIERFSSTLWHSVIYNVLQAPGWLVLGLPGGLLTWYCRPNRVMSAAVREEYERQRESLFVIDELSREAKLDENYDPEEDDRAPVHLLFDMEQDDDEDIQNNMDPGDHPAGYPAADYADDYLRDLAEDQRVAREVNSDDIENDVAEHVRIVDGLPFTETNKLGLNLDTNDNNNDTKDDDWLKPLPPEK